MNPDTVALIQRPFGRIVDDLLTAMAGGVVNEPIPFDLRTPLYPLAQPAAAVRSVTGTVQQQPHTFVVDVDVTFDPARNALAFLPGGAHPDDETTFFVDYFRPDSASPLTDLNVGSVTRTLTEALAREIATLYAELNEAYRAGFVDTATRTSLDLVVSILGVTRKTSEYAEGLVTFLRDPAVDGDITIAAGTLLRTTAGTAEFETSEQRTLQRGQARVDVPVRAAAGFAGDAGTAAAGEITVLAQAIAGISRITNLDPTTRPAQDESDTDLRQRALAAVRSLGGATLAALVKAVGDERAGVLEVWDPDGPPTQRSDPGTVVLLADAQPQRFPGLRTAVHDARAAGVQATVLGRFVYLTPRVVGTVAAGVPAAGRVKIVQQVVDAVASYAGNLKSGQAAVGGDLLTAIRAVAGLGNPRIVEVLAATTDLSAPGPEQVLDELVAAVPVAGADSQALRTAFAPILAGSGPPADRVVPAPELVVGPGGAPATDAEIEAGTFQVLATVGGRPWWIAAQMTAADVLLVTGG